MAIKRKPWQWHGCEQLGMRFTTKEIASHYSAWQKELDLSEPILPQRIRRGFQAEVYKRRRLLQRPIEQTEPIHPAYWMNEGEQKSLALERLEKELDAT